MHKEYRTVKEVVGPLMLVDQVTEVKYGELVEIEVGKEIRHGQVLEANGDKALVQLFEGSTGLNLFGSKVRFLGRSMEIGVSRMCLAGSLTGWAVPKIMGRRSSPTAGWM